jgi:hypothetical protein
LKPALRAKLIATVAVLFVAQLFIHSGLIVDKWLKNYSPGKGVLVGNIIAPDQILLELFGFREFLAGILWVRADTFFDEGNYDAVLPIIRLCTILDPKQIDIYATGMWHIAYNFTDEEQRSDRRYIAPALALGKEGSAQNANTYELFFETGWIWYHKVDDDYDRAVEWFDKAIQKPDMLPARKNLLAHAYERDNKILQALDMYYKLLEDAKVAYKKEDSIANMQEVDTLQNNADTLLVRMVQRGWLAEKRGQYQKGDYDTKPPFDVGFSVRATVEDPKVIRFQGTWNVLPVGTRIRVVLRDEEIYDNHQQRIDEPAQMKWDANDTVDLEPSKEITYMQDQLFVKNRRFDKRCDLSKDPTMYPFSSKHKRYVIEFYYNARSAPAHIQDKFGWNGEGMTDKSYMNTQIRPGQKVLYAKLYVDRDQILRRGEWANKVPIIQTSNFNDKTATGADDRVITLSSAIRGSSSNRGQ